MHEIAGIIVTLLRIQHPVADFARWKAAFDADPADRRGSGVRRYTVRRQVSDPNFVMIDLEFDSVRDAELMLGRMHRIWADHGGILLSDADAWIVDDVESVDLS